MATIPQQRRKELNNDIHNFFKLYPLKYFKMRVIKKWLNDEMKYNYNQQEIIKILLEMNKNEEIECIQRGSYWLYKYKKVVN